jgi:hypothetical protein
MNTNRYKIVLGSKRGIIYEVSSYDFKNYACYDTQNESPIINFIEKRDFIFALHENGKVSKIKFKDDKFFKVKDLKFN